MNKTYRQEWFGNIKGDILGGLVTTFSVIPEVIGFTLVAGVNPILGLYTSMAFLILSSFLGGRPALVSAGAGSVAMVVVSLISGYGTDYLFVAVFLAGIIQIILGFLKIGNLLKYVPPSVMSGFVDALAIMIFTAQIKNCSGGDLQMFLFIGLSIIIVYVFPFITRKVPSTLIAIILVTIISCLLGNKTITIGELGNIKAAFPTIHAPTLLLDINAWKIVLPYSISLAFVGLIETLLTTNVVNEMTNTESSNNRECKSQGTINMVCGIIGAMPGCAMIGQAIVNVKSGGRGRLSTMFSGIFLIFIIGIGSILLNIIPLAALIGVMITVSIATFDWQYIKEIKQKSFVELITTISTVIVVVLTDNLAYGVGIGLVIFYLGKVMKSKFINKSNTYKKELL